MGRTDETQKSISFIPNEYRAVAEKLFPQDDIAAGTDILNSVVEFAEVLGIASDFRRLLAARNGNDAESLRQFIRHFQNNIDLLIQKSWVEKADEERKESLLKQVPFFVESFEKNDYKTALDKFSSVLNELSYLFFGAQSRKDDFIEYAFRIDDQMGLFWWYAMRLYHLFRLGSEYNGIHTFDEKSLEAMLLLGLCYLTNF